jgi:hypothetical protein
MRLPRPTRRQWVLGCGSAIGASAIPFAYRILNAAEPVLRVGTLGKVSSSFHSSLQRTVNGLRAGYADHLVRREFRVIAAPTLRVAREATNIGSMPILGVGGIADITGKRIFIPEHLVLSTHTEPNSISGFSLCHEIGHLILFAVTNAARSLTDAIISDLQAFHAAAAKADAPQLPGLMLNHIRRAILLKDFIEPICDILGAYIYTRSDIHEDDARLLEENWHAYYFPSTIAWYAQREAAWLAS